MLAGLVLSEAQAHAGLGSIDEVERALRRAEEHYARAQEAPDEWVGIVVLPDHSDLPAGRANAYSRLARHDQRFAMADQHGGAAPMRQTDRRDVSEVTVEHRGK